MRYNILRHFIKYRDENIFQKSVSSSEACEVTKTVVSSRCTTKNTSPNEYTDEKDDESLDDENTISDVNLSNVFQTNSKLIQADSYIWPEVNMSIHACDGHECLEPKDLNQTVLFQAIKRKMQPKFTPPMFPKSGILSCPDIPPVESVKASRQTQPSDLRDDMDYLIPGNLEFIQFTYPKVGNAFRYSTYAIPNNRFEWMWVYDYMNNIMNSFRRKYLCEVRLATEPGFYKGRVAYLVRIESDTQGNILRCRSGLPKAFKDMLVTPFNAINDINCYITEYLIKRKYIFKKISSQETDEKLINSNISNYNVSSLPTINRPRSLGRLNSQCHQRNEVDFLDSSFGENGKSRTSFMNQDPLLTSRTKKVKSL